MKSLFSAFFVAAFFALPAYPARAQTADNSGPLAAFDSLLATEAQPPAAAPALTLDQVERMALAANPEIVVAVRRVAVAEAHIPAAGALDDPVAMYRGWGVPLRKPWDFNQAQNMFSLSRTLPGAGKRALRTSQGG